MQSVVFAIVFSFIIFVQRKKLLGECKVAS
jgi:hypothetical protein